MKGLKSLPAKYPSDIKNIEIKPKVPMSVASLLSQTAGCLLSFCFEKMYFKSIEKISAIIEIMNSSGETTSRIKSAFSECLN